MIVKRNIKIMEITHDEIVNLISTALYGSLFLSVEYNKEFYNSIPENKRVGDCFEDKIADVLLNGGEIYLYDNDSDGEIYNECYNAEVINESDGKSYTQYTITLVELIDGLQRAANGTYKINDDFKWVTSCFNSFENDDCDFDLYKADTLIQIIMFNELIYG